MIEFISYEPFNLIMKQMYKKVCEGVFEYISKKFVKAIFDCSNNCEDIKTDS